MPIDKETLNKLKKYAEVFKNAREQDTSEANTVMYLIEFFKDVLDYDPLLGEISRELQIKERYCDFGIRLGDKVVFIVEAKSAGIKSLNAKHIEQAGNYASHGAINWVLLTNGVEWHLYHLTFEAGIQHDLVFDLNFVDGLEKNPDFVWDTLSILAKSNVEGNSLQTYYEQKKLLSPKTVVNILLGEEVLMKVRQELNRKAPARLELTSVFHAVLQVLRTEAVAEAGDITPPAKKRRRKRRKIDGSMGEESVEEDAESGEEETEIKAEQSTPAAPLSDTASHPKPTTAPPASN